MEKDFYFINEDDQNMVFHRLFYYEFVCLLATKILNATNLVNDIHKNFFDYLVQLQSFQDVYFLTSEMPYYWAINIAENKKSIKDLTDEQRAMFSTMYNFFLVEKGIEDFIESDIV